MWKCLRKSSQTELRRFICSGCKSGRRSGHEIQPGWAKRGVLGSSVQASFAALRFSGDGGVKGEGLTTSGYWGVSGSTVCRPIGDQLFPTNRLTPRRDVSNQRRRPAPLSELISHPCRILWLPRGDAPFVRTPPPVIHSGSLMISVWWPVFVWMLANFPSLGLTSLTRQGPDESTSEHKCLKWTRGPFVVRLYFNTLSRKCVSCWINKVV